MAAEDKSRADEGSLTLCRRAPLLRALLAKGWSPLAIGAGFFILVSLPLSLIATLTVSGSGDSDYVSYWENISWPLSILILFPFIVALTVKYYRRVPALFRELATDLPDEERPRFLRFLKTADMAFNPPLLYVAFLLLTLGLNAIYYSQALDPEQGSSWITDGSLLRGLLIQDTGFSVAGLFSVVVQVGLVYWMTHLAWNAVVFAWALHRFFREFGPSIEVKPLHEDGCSGLKRIGDVSMIFNVVLFLVGLYLSLKVIDRIVVQNQSLLDDIGNPVFLGSYALLAPLLFFLPLAAPHRRMEEVKRDYLRPLVEQYAAQVDSIRVDGEDRYEELAKLDSLIKALKKRLPVWPFNVRSLKSFFGAVVTPVLPVALPFAVDAIASLLSRGPTPA